jgi:hypothetical protein
VGPRAGLDAVSKRQNLDRPALSQSLYRLSYHGSVAVNSGAKALRCLSGFRQLRTWSSGGLSLLK